MEQYFFEKKGNTCFCSDRINGIKCTFDLHGFNDTQQFEIYDKKQTDVSKIARACREMGDWLNENHYNEIF